MTTFHDALDVLEAIAETGVRVKAYAYRTHTGDCSAPKREWRGDYVFEMVVDELRLTTEKILALTDVGMRFMLDLEMEGPDEDAGASITFRPRLQVDEENASEEFPNREDKSANLDRQRALVLLARLAEQGLGCTFHVWKTDSQLGPFPPYLYDFHVGTLLRASDAREVLTVLESLGMTGWVDDIHVQYERDRSVV